MTKFNPAGAFEALNRIREAGSRISMVSGAMKALGDSFDFSEATLFHLPSRDSEPVIIDTLNIKNEAPLTPELSREIGPILPLLNSTGRAMISPSDLLNPERKGEKDRKESRKGSGLLSINGMRNAIAIPCPTENEGDGQLLLVMMNLNSEFLAENRRGDFDWDRDLLNIGELMSRILELDLERGSAERIHQALETISGIGMLLNSSMDATTLIRNVNARICELLDAEGCSVILRDTDTNSLKFFAVWGERSEMIEKVSIPEGTGIAGWVIDNGMHWISITAAHDEKFSPFVDIITDFNTRNVLAVPMKVAGRIIGAVEVVNKKRGRNFDDQDVDLLFCLAFQIALLVTRSRELEELGSLLKKKEAALFETNQELSMLKSNLQAENAERLETKARVSQLSENLNQKSMECSMANRRISDMTIAMNEMAARIDSRERELESLRTDMREIVTSSPVTEKNDNVRQLSSRLSTFFMKALKALGSSENLCGTLIRGEGGRSFKDREEIYEDISDHIVYSRRLVSMAGDLSFFLSGKKLILSENPFDLNRLVMDEVHKWMGQAESTGQPIHFSPESSLPMLIRGNPDSFSHMLGLLLDNSIKHSRSSQMIFVKTHRDEGCAFLTITDKGRGFDPSLTNAAMTPFVKLPGTGMSADSMGLGLPLARYIAIEHGGSLNLKTSPGMGTEIEIKIPLT
ncbi:MAG: hypothetical protein CVV64_01475 [Candidatus Wallbacteria bacterium HGW-Wallbacteria-1]|jgi:signal transduction histidine kinase|uniref:histidine kinase n=1 Tax=Candidatus Wallbacteria bacterium HGW-Wallbacteria-1 TaxID=2013854 RepID=A0A2N1PUX5_9BACT|nr:MAG: hypothetical protein CVV64_01475 [Candidatus Wallbacteria bacterium HGW-Wallbacteria-1]